MLKLKLKISRWNRTARKDGLEMFHRLQDRLGLRAWGRGLSAAEPDPHRSQTLFQFPSQAINRFHRKGHPQFFHRCLEGKSGQQIDQPWPHQRSGQSVSRQNVRQEQGKGASAPTALSTIGAIHPLAPERFSVRGVGIIAQRPAVPVQTAKAAAMRTRRLLEGKRLVFNSCASRTK